jgi:hypothetical protein
VASIICRSLPDGFYLVGDSPNPQLEFERAIIEKVATVTQIAPPDASGKNIGEEVVQPGVINCAVASLGLCAGLTGASTKYTTTTAGRCTQTAYLVFSKTELNGWPGQGGRCGECARVHWYRAHYYTTRKLR